MRTFAAVAALSLVGVLAGCGQWAPYEPDRHVPRAHGWPPVFADDEALIAAQESYGAYLLAVDLGLATYKTSHLGSVAAEVALAEALDSVASFQERGRKLVGGSVSDSMTIVARDNQTIQVSVCLDISGTDVVDASGASVAPTDGTHRLPMTVEMTWDRALKHFLITATELWDGDDFCN